jgi:hypothetical protein
MVLYLDYEKAYDWVDRAFLVKMLAQRGFSFRFFRTICFMLDK